MIAFSFGPLHIYWYGIFYAIAFACAYFFFLLVKKWSFLEAIGSRFWKIFSFQPESMLLYAMIGGLL